RAFAGRSEDLMTTVVFSTHLDDAVFSCYSALGQDTTVVTVLGGVPPDEVLGGWDRDGGATSSRGRVLERRAEDHRALLLSASVPVHLDFPERQQWGQAGIAPPAFDELAATITRLIAGAEIVYAPAGIHNGEHKL